MAEQRKCPSSVNSVSRITLLNEMFLGQEYEYIMNRMEDLQEPPMAFGRENFHICFMGIPKRVYTNIYHVPVIKCMEIFVAFQKYVLAYWALHDIVGEVELHIYWEKQIVMVFQRGKACDVSALEMAEHFVQYLQEQYERSYLTDGRYANVAALSPLLSGYEQLGGWMHTVRQWTDASFFYMSPWVVTEERIHQLPRGYSYEEILEDLNRLKQMVIRGDVFHWEGILSELVLNKLKASREMNYCQDVLSELKHMYVRYCRAYDLEQTSRLNEVFEARAYASIEEMHESLHRILKHMNDAVKEREKRLSILSQEAVHYIKRNYVNAELSLNIIASYLYVAPSYLSRVFNQEVGISIPKFISSVRIEQAQKLLVEKEYKSFEVAKKCGFRDVKYFRQVFRDHLGMSPAEYREMKRNNLIDKA